ncbi:MAG: DUF433 domain-containing protein [Deltaproteobacteria bacterium]|nr:DUF433 domain-containing protein [Deltaproteobacteria bacterium]
MKSNIREHVEITPGVSGGKPRIAGHRIRVMDIVLWQTKCGWSPDEIVSQFPQLSLADVHAALAYYWDHKEEIEADIRSAEEIEAKSRRKHPSILKGKLETRQSEVLSRRTYSKSRG